MNASTNTSIVHRRVPRTTSGCLTCRKGSVKCDETRPTCNRCQRLQKLCEWGEEKTIIQLLGHDLEFKLLIDKPTIPYIQNFITYCSPFLCYSNDDENNPFQKDLFLKSNSSPALLYSMAAVAAGHLSQTQRSPEDAAIKYYACALKALHDSLSDPVTACLDSTLGACLLLCVYEISYSEDSDWLTHLQGARDLILSRNCPNYLTRFFRVLDISGSLLSSNNPLIPDNYWVTERPVQTNNLREQNTRWPYYDNGGIMVTHFDILMGFMAKLAQLSSKSRNEPGAQDLEEEGLEIHKNLLNWWNTCPPQLRNQDINWREKVRLVKLTLSETLQQEAFSSMKSCLQGCVIYLNHILDPLGHKPQKQVVETAIQDIINIAKKIPPGYGLEMGHYFGLFMVGITIFNDIPVEETIRQQLKADQRIGVYHTGRALQLLKLLWNRQHQYGTKYDWREVQDQIGMQIFILV